MSWMRVEMTPTEAAGNYEGFMEEYFDAFQTAGLPKDAAMFVSMDPSREGAFYFSSAAERFFEPALKARGAHPCAVPSRKSVALLVGNGPAMDMLDP